MQPDIDNEINAEFAERQKVLSNVQGGAWGNVQAANKESDAPEISKGNIEQMAKNFRQQQTKLDNEINSFRDERVGFRANFLIDKYYEDASEEEKSAIFDAVQNSLNPPIQEQETETGTESEQGDYFNPDDFAYADNTEKEEGLSETFSDAATPETPLLP